jgi:Tol biopolymer transport system component
MHDIYHARMAEGEFQRPVALGPAVNTEAYEADVFVAPDESYVIFTSTREGGQGRGDLYVSFRDAEGDWSEAVNMESPVNSGDYEYCPFVTADGKYLLFTSRQDIYIVGTGMLDPLRPQ